MRAETQEELEHLLGTRILKWSPLSGGDIAQAYLLETAHDRLFCKFLSGDSGYSMLLAEREGLERIRATGAVNTPKVFFCESFWGEACLGMELIETKTPSPAEMRMLGTQVAQMHGNLNDAFGFPSDNFIGSLPQSNKSNLSWVSFYVKERLMPQFQMALSKALLAADEIPNEELLLENLGTYLDQVKPSLLHGDLWSGNYLIAVSGEPYLIDPAIYYGDAVVDLAMYRLFGGFGPDFYKGYVATAGVYPYEIERTEIYQLYYLLVHLNLFGRSYYGSVKNILRTYF
ncbi:MAG: fructosamine kinase family protein [Eudoraea sp.]|nr:fructosamine kinase family protein [Eudoraea sp.]